jgi:uncharacterized protein YodC (DUF2158 family)
MSRYPLKFGDIVRFKFIDGPNMVVGGPGGQAAEFQSGGQALVHCSWFDTCGRLQTAQLFADHLEIAPVEEDD